MAVSGKTGRGQSTALNLTDYGRYLAAAIFVGFCLFPLYIVLSTAVKKESDIFAWPPVWLFEPTFENIYVALFVFGGSGVLPFLINSIIVTAFSTLVAVG
ncbi:MAG: hypothetical protein GY788_24030, partial [bacterium]|nr:hypothetical protein [bacterium]